MSGRREIFSDEQIEGAIAYHDAGHTWQEAADHLGISLNRLLVRASAFRGRPYPSSLVRKVGSLRASSYEIDKLRSLQEGKCGICGKVVKKLVVDHCWRRNKIRGLLCMPCNAALGWIEKGGKTGWLSQALAYLKRSTPTQLKRRIDEHERSKAT